ncbi:MAG: hypothetical protein AB2417_18270 [Clostridiaceae bacterium]
MSINIKLLILIILAGVIFRLHIWELNKSYKRLLEEKQENSTEDIFKYLYDLSKIQANSNFNYFLLIVGALLLLF